jgi:anaerobic selenocysteine-containing dehydrogenase
VRRIAKELSESQQVVVLGGDSAAAHTSGSFNLAAINYLASIVNGSASARHVLKSDSGNGRTPSIADLVKDAQLVLVHAANPVFHAPAAFGFSEALGKVPFIVSFSSFEDETTAFADLILPDHTPLERWDDNLPLEGVASPIVSLSQPVVAPLYQTRQTGDVLLALAAKIPEISSGFKAEGFKSLIEESHFKDPGEREAGWEQAILRGGIWPEEQAKPAAGQQPRVAATIGQEEQAQFAGDEREYPFHFLPYEHLALGVGETANQPLLQSLPDPLTAVSWGSWVEINPEMAARHDIRQGDLLSIESPHGRIEAPAIIYPGIRPDVVAMPCGQGHERYGRYASNRGSNPIRILAPLAESKTGALAWAATRVRITKLNRKSGMVTSGTNERLLEDRRDLKR